MIVLYQLAKPFTAGWLAGWLTMLTKQATTKWSIYAFRHIVIYSSAWFVYNGFAITCNKAADAYPLIHDYLFGLHEDVVKCRQMPSMIRSCIKTKWCTMMHAAGYFTQLPIICLHLCSCAIISLKWYLYWDSFCYNKQ